MPALMSHALYVTIMHALVVSVEHPIVRGHLPLDINQRPIRHSLAELSSS